MGVISIGIDHEHASLDLLERATITEDSWGKVLRSLVAHRNIHEAVFVSTCLRTEVVAVIDLFHGAIEDVTATLSEVTGLAPSEFEHSLTVHFDRAVSQHLFSVASGLKSVVPGEFEILGQLRRALDVATEENTAGPELTELFQRAIATGRHVRSETNIARGTTSFAQASVSLAVEQSAGKLQNDVLVIGAGQLASGIVKSLLSTPNFCASLVVANRTVSKAHDLCADIADPRLRAASLDELASHVQSSQIVFSAIETTTPVVTREMLQSVAHDQLIVDLGMPRTVTHDTDDLTAIKRFDISDLRERVEGALEGRREALAQANGLVALDVEKYLSDVRSRGAATIVSELRARFDEIIDAEIARRDGDLSDLSEVQREKVASIIRSVVAKVAHKPTIALKETAGTDRGVKLSEATRNLFDL